MESETAKILRELAEEFEMEIAFYHVEIMMQNFSKYSKEEFEERIQYLQQKIDLINNEFNS